MTYKALPGMNYSIDVKYYYFYYYLKVFFNYLCSLLFLQPLLWSIPLILLAFLDEKAETSDNEASNFEHVYCPLSATVENDLQIIEPDIR